MAKKVHNLSLAEAEMAETISVTTGTVDGSSLAQFVGETTVTERDTITAVRSPKPRREWLRAEAPDAPGRNAKVGVDRRTNTIHGFVVAQLGVLKDRRAELTDKSLAAIIKLGNAQPKGVKSRFGHPSLSDDGLGKFLGRSTNFRLDNDRVRADLALDKTSFNTPHGNLGGHVLDVVESDPDAISSSVVIKVDEELQLDEDGRRIMGEDGHPIPPIWHPVELHASDIVETGAAVDGLLSADIQVAGLPDGVVRQAVELLDQQFGGKSRDFVHKRLSGFLDRYLDQKFYQHDTGGTNVSDKNLEANEDQLLPGTFEPPPGAHFAELKSTDPTDSVVMDKLLEKTREEAFAKGRAQAEDEMTELIAAEKEAADLKAKRDDDIRAMCKMHSVNAEKLEKFLADESLSADGLKDALLSQYATERELTEDVAGDRLAEKPAEDKKYHDEYLANQKAYPGLMTCTEDEFVASRKITEEKSGEILNFARAS